MKPASILLAANTIAGAMCKVLVGYAPLWKDIGDVDLAKYTHVNLAYGTPLANGTIVFESSYSLADCVPRIHQAGAKALLSVGGWTGERYMSDILMSPYDRNELVKSTVSLVTSNNLDGVEIAWAYPGKANNKCDKFDIANDANNLLEFLKQLRAELTRSSSGQPKLITMSVGVVPFQGPGGPLKDVSAFAPLIDLLSVIAYDINGPWLPTTGPNSPLKNEAGRGAPYSFSSAIDSWTAAKFPAEKLVAGIGLFGRSSTASQDMTRDSTNQYQPQLSSIPRGDKDDGLWEDKCSGNPAGFSGIWSYKNLREQGVLKAPDAASNGWNRYWDDRAQVPWLFSTTTNAFISYDDMKSVAAKVSLAVAKGLGGIMVWDITMDYQDELIGEIRKGVGLKPLPRKGPVPSQAIALPPLHVDTFVWPAGPTQSTAPVTNPPPQGGGNGGNSNNSNGSRPTIGGQCGPNVNYRCMSDNHKSQEFATCAGGTWILQQCGTGTACVQNGASVYCDYHK